MRRVAGASIAVLAMLGWAAPASAAPQQRATVDESSPMASFGTDGSAMVTWSRFSAGQDALHSTILDQAGAPGPIVDTGGLSGEFVTGPGGHRAFVASRTDVIVISRIDDAGRVESTETITSPGLSDVKTAFDAGGRMTITWEVAPGADDSTVYALRTDPQGEPGPIREVFPDGLTRDWRIATDSQGRTVVARTAPGRIDIVTLDADGVPGPVTLVRDYQPAGAGVSVDAQDRPTIAWTEQGEALLRRVESDGTLGAIRTVAENAGISAPHFDATGGGTVFLSLESGSLGAARGAPDGSVGPVRAVAPPSGGTINVGVDDLGRTRVTWEKERRIETVLLDSSGNPGGTRTITELSASPNQWSRGMHVDMAVDSVGRATVAWTESPADGPNGSSGPIRAIRIAADGSFGQIHTLSPGDQSPPVLTLGPRKQQLDSYVSVSTACDEFCRYVANGYVEILKKRDGRWKPKARIPLRGIDDADNLCRPSGHLCAKDLGLGMSAEDFTRARRVLERGNWLVATVHVRAEDRAGLTDTATQEIRLKRRAPKAR